MHQYAKLLDPLPKLPGKHNACCPRSLFPSFHHQNMISKSRLHFSVFGTCKRTSLKLKSLLLKSRVQITSLLPTQSTSYMQTLAKNPTSLCQPRKHIPALALSSENSFATSSNFAPPFNFSRASSFFACFSHCHPSAPPLASEY